MELGEGVTLVKKRSSLVHNARVEKEDGETSPERGGERK